MPKIGIVGSLVWDLIYGRDPLALPVEEWGGIAYALAALDASLSPDWEIVPLIKVGRDLGREARQLLSGLTRLTPGGRCVEVTAPNNRVVLHYQSTERRCERMAGGVPGWTWTEPTWTQRRAPLTVLPSTGAAGSMSSAIAPRPKRYL